MSDYYEQFLEYISGSFLQEYLRIGNTVHIISFSKVPKVEIARRLEGVGDVETILGRFYLMYPLSSSPRDLQGVLNYAEEYIDTLPVNRSKKVVLLTSAGGGLQLRRKGIPFTIVRFPLPAFSRPAESGENFPPSPPLPVETLRPPSQRIDAPGGAEEKEPAAPIIEPGKIPDQGVTDTVAGIADTAVKEPAPVKDPPLEKTEEQKQPRPPRKPAPVSIPEAADPREQKPKKSIFAFLLELLSKLKERLSSIKPAPVLPPATTKGPAVAEAPAIDAPLPIPKPETRETQKPVPEAPAVLPETPLPFSEPEKPSMPNDDTPPEAPEIKPLIPPVLERDTPVAVPSETPETQVPPPSPPEAARPAPETVEPPEREIISMPEAAPPKAAPVEKPKDQNKKNGVKEKVKQDWNILPVAGIIILALAILFAAACLLYFLIRRLNSNPLRAETYISGRSVSTPPRRIEPRIIPKEDLTKNIPPGGTEDAVEMNPMVCLVVEDQNCNIGRRNIHILKEGNIYTVGGGNSDFLIFLVPLPYHIGEIRFDGSRVNFVPIKPKFFPDIGSQTVQDCIGKNIRVISDTSFEIFIRVERYEDPLLSLNALMNSIGQR
jgi:hypothetical protein